MESKKSKVISEEEKEKYKNMNIKINYTFKEYYRNLLTHLNQIEFEKFYESMSKKLPITFRINKIYNYCEFLEIDLNNIFYNMGVIDKVNKYNWNGFDNIYEISFEIDKTNKEHRVLKDLLVCENDLGVLRQELVSMIPVSLVDIEEDSVVMDMCAAPGNKSVQILEIMQEKGREKNILPTGVLISNELDFRRGEKLVHFLQSQPTINVISTLCPAQDFPKIENSLYQPDYVFCDVPCSGDGTLRKNKGLRKRWRPDYGYKNHKMQIDILENSIRLCKVGGKVIYSTCSINPIENEAVVAYILEKYKNKIEVANIHPRVKNKLKINCSEGLVKWKVAYDWKDNQNIKFAYDFSQVDKNKHLINESMFHEIYTKKNFQNNVYFSDPLNLRRCARFYSYQNNSGSFFVAVIDKKEEINFDGNSSMNIGQTIPLNNENKIMSIKDELRDFVKFLRLENDEKHQDLIHELNKPNDEKFNNEFFVTQPKSEEDPVISFDKFVKFKDYTENYKFLKEFYNFKNENLLSDQLYCLRTTSIKILLFSQKLCEVVKILSNMSLNIIHAGLVCFTRERTNTPGKYRLSHYGTIILEPFIQNQKLILESTPENEKFFFDLLKSKKMKFDEIIEKIRPKITNFKIGSLIVIYDSMAVICRRGNNNLSIMIPDIQLNNLSTYAFKFMQNK